jgi:uncharacterized protein YjbI with pentapeptide repeats
MSEQEKQLSTSSPDRQPAKAAGPTNQQRPTTNDRHAWTTYWKAQGQPWRTEPEIDAERQAYLAESRLLKPDLEEGIYPFKNIKLKRADVEWLLATHENGRGPVDWSDERERKGIDLRGADLRQADLRHLPLAHMLGGLNWRERDRTPERRDMAAVHLEGAILSWAHLEEAELYMAYLEKADLYKSHLEGASLRKAHFEGASLRRAHLESKFIPTGRQKQTRQELEAHPTMLPPADLRGAFFDNTTDLRSIFLGDEKHGVVRLADVHWEGVNLAVLDWSPIKILGDEIKARKTIDELGKKKGEKTYINEYREAVRANRQLSVELLGQGLNEVAARFAYRAQRLQRVILRRRRHFGQYLFSLFLDLLAGYGYRPGRSVFWYLVIICGFAIAYSSFGHLSLLPDAFVFSLTSFHGRGLFPGLDNKATLHNPLVVLAAIEAVIGLFIEISFIATFTKRFFGS